MLFLFSKPFQFILVSCVFLNSSNSINSFSIDNSDNIQLRISNANLELSTQDSNFLIYLVLGLLLITAICIISVISLKRIALQGQEKINTLNKVVSEQKNEGLQKQQKIHLYSSLFYNLDFRLNKIKESINNLYNDFNMSDSKLKDEVFKVNEYVNEIRLAYSKSLALIEKM